jgi:hypothetical protein
MAQYLAEERLNSEGEPDRKTLNARKRRPYKKKAKLVIDQEVLNADSSTDSDFVSESSDSDSSGVDIQDNEPLTNAEVSSVRFRLHVLIP